MILCIFAAAQDRVYLQDGSVRIAKVTEIGPDYITAVPISESGAPFQDEDETIGKEKIILIEYKNGSVDYFHNPENSMVVGSKEDRKRKEQKMSDKVIYHNFASINTLALCNSDIAGFFEHLSNNTHFGFGAMAAYNFNRYAGVQNLFISVLNNAKKRYDAGVFLNVYPAGFKRRAAFYFGLMFKYTYFTYSSVVEEKVNGTTLYKYVPSSGSQLATIITLGSQVNLTKTIFLKTIAGLGAFNLRGDYKDQYNYRLNSVSTSSPTTSNNQQSQSTLLPKIYLGINVGVNF